MRTKKKLLKQHGTKTKPYIEFLVPIGSEFAKILNKDPKYKPVLWPKPS